MAIRLAGYRTKRRRDTRSTMVCRAVVVRLRLDHHRCTVGLFIVIAYFTAAFKASGCSCFREVWVDSDSGCIITLDVMPAEVKIPL